MLIKTNFKFSFLNIHKKSNKNMFIVVIKVIFIIYCKCKICVQKNKIFQNGLLNDVSTACFIKGRSAEYIYKKDKVNNKLFKQIATDAYNLACKYSKGRCWDPQGWFWSPCQASSERIPIE